MNGTRISSLALVALVASGGAALAANVIQSEPDQAAACKAVGITQTAGTPAMPEGRRLGDLPDGKEYRLVLRMIGGCQVAEVVRYDAATGQSYVVQEAVGADNLGKLDRNIPSFTRKGFATPTPVQPPPTGKAP